MDILKSFKRAKKTLGTLLLAGTLAAVAGCSGGGGGGGGGGSSGGDKDKDENKAPVFTSAPITTVNENSNYNYDADGYDPEGKTVSYAFEEKPTGMTINSSTGQTSWTPDDSQSDKNHLVRIRISDGSKSTTQEYNLYVVNTENLQITVIDEDGNPLDGREVTLKNASRTYNATVTGGIAEFNNVVDGTYDQNKVSDSLAMFEDFTPGYFRVSKTDETTAGARLYLRSKRNALEETIRRHGAGLAKYKSKPSKITIYTLEEKTGNPVNAATIASVEDIFINDTNTFTQNKFNFVAGDIQQVNTKVPGNPPEGEIYIYWDDNLPAGAGTNNSWVDGFEVKRSYARFNTGATKPVHLQEIMEMFLGSTSTNEAEIKTAGLEPTSIFYNAGGVLPTATELSNFDQLVGRLAYGQYQLLSGNKNEGVAGRYNVDLVTKQWNKTYIAPAANKWIKPALKFKWDYTPKEDDCPDEDYEVPKFVPRKEDIPEVF